MKMKKLILIAALTLSGCANNPGGQHYQTDWGAVGMGLQLMNQSYQQPPAVIYPQQMTPRGWAPGWGYR